MTAYLVANLQVTDPAKFDSYRRQVAPLIDRHGGRYLVRGGEVTAAEGDPGLHRLVIVEFADMARLRRFYDSPEDAPLIRLRQEGTTGSVALVEGYTSPV
jgi:uncharacterized protein (DUF1330 family)